MVAVFVCWGYIFAWCSSNGFGHLVFLCVFMSSLAGGSWVWFPPVFFCGLFGFGMAFGCVVS